jgi:hypothetical protein
MLESANFFLQACRAESLHRWKNTQCDSLLHPVPHLFVEQSYLFNKSLLSVGLYRSNFLIAITM